MSRSRRKTGSVLGDVAAVAVTLLRPWPDNPRRISGERLEALKQSMVADPAMLWARPLLALRDGTVFSGNQRLRVARELGWESIPVLYVDLDVGPGPDVGAPRQRRLRGVGRAGPGRAARRARRRGHRPDPDRAHRWRHRPDPGRDPRPRSSPTRHRSCPTGPPDSRPGEVYELGNHRLLCGDARSSADLAALIGTEKVELVLTDPPYGVSYTGKTRAGLTIRNDGEEGLEPLLTDAFAAINPFLALRGALLRLRPCRAARNRFPPLDRHRRLAAPPVVGLGQGRDRARTLRLPLPPRGHPLRPHSRSRTAWSWPPAGQPLVRRKRGGKRVLRRPAEAQPRAPDDQAGRAAQPDAPKLHPSRRHRARPLRRLRLHPDRLRTSWAAAAMRSSSTPPTAT